MLVLSTNLESRCTPQPVMNSFTDLTYACSNDLRLLQWNEEFDIASPDQGWFIFGWIGLAAGCRAGGGKLRSTIRYLKPHIRGALERAGGPPQSAF